LPCFLCFALLWSDLLGVTSFCFASRCFAFSSLHVLKMNKGNKEAAEDLENERQWEFLKTWRPEEEQHPHFNIEPLLVTRLQCQFNAFFDHLFSEVEWSSFELTLDQDAVGWPNVLVSFPVTQSLASPSIFSLFFPVLIYVYCCAANTLIICKARAA
jgi:hypothetical protein